MQIRMLVKRGLVQPSSRGRADSHLLLLDKVLLEKGKEAEYQKLASRCRCQAPRFLGGHIASPVKNVEFGTHPSLSLPACSCSSLSPQTLLPPRRRRAGAS